MTKLIYMYFCKRLVLFIFCSVQFMVIAQSPIGLQVDSNQIVLFGSDTMCCGPKMMWLPSKQSMLVGEMLWPYDSIGQFSLTAGRSMASGMLSASFGQSLAIGDYSFAAGASGAIGPRSFAAGGSSAFAQYSTALGQSSASGVGSFTAGFSSAGGIVSVALGNAHAAGNSSAALNLARADAYMCTAIGRYNLGGGDAVNYVSTDPIFEVGIGANSSNRRNAFTIRKDGFISMGNHLGYTKFALYESGASTYGMGVQAGQFRFNIGNPQARYAFFDQPGSGAAEIFTVYGNGRVNTGGSLNVNGDITINGVLIHSSDRNRKEDIREVNYQDILHLVDALPVATWQYKEQEGRHIGPMAQDFYASFGLGTGDTGIAGVDADGVALAAIKGLIAKIEAMQQEINVMKQQLELQRDGHQK